MIDEYRKEIRSRDHEKNIDLKYRLLNTVEGFIEVMELREEDSEEDSGEEEKAEAEENDTPEEGKKSKTKEESD